MLLRCAKFTKNVSMKKRRSFFTTAVDSFEIMRYHKKVNLAKKCHKLFVTYIGGNVTCLK